MSIYKAAFPTRFSLSFSPHAYITSTSLTSTMIWSITTFVLSATALSVSAIPSGLDTLHPRQAPDNLVEVSSTNKFCIIAPRNAHTDIGDSEHPGGMKTYCSSAARTSSAQGQLPADFWRNVAFKSGKGVHGGRFAQLTGCINSSHLDRLNPDDAGGQYDSSGGIGGRGNPAGSVCRGYKHYVELLEPRGPRACIKCCDDPADCPVNRDTSGCPNVIPGNYFNCG